MEHQKETEDDMLGRITDKKAYDGIKMMELANKEKATKIKKKVIEYHNRTRMIVTYQKYKEIAETLQNNRNIHIKRRNGGGFYDLDDDSL